MFQVVDVLSPHQRLLKLIFKKGGLGPADATIMAKWLRANQVRAHHGHWTEHVPRRPPLAGLSAHPPTQRTWWP